MPQLAAISLSELQELLKAQNQPAFRAKQILDWRNKGITDPAEMRNLPIELKQTLETFLHCQALRLVRKQTSSDGTRKYLFALTRGSHAGKLIETVMIPEATRNTVCVSSQVGCVLDCPFCFTGTQKFEVNLTAAEIIAQILAVKHDLLHAPMPAELHASITHVVFMGMGEPMANEQAVLDALNGLMSEEGLNISRRRITVSTSGLVPQIRRMGEEMPVNLAISLHAAMDELRDQLVPINRKYPLAELRSCLDDYPLPNQRHITLEYVMLAGVNDRPEDLQALCVFVRKDRERVNLIHFNPYPSNPYQASSINHMNEFAKGLISKGIRATVRRSRGQDIMAACGQLKGCEEE